jgi:hypothetical protein
MLRHITVGTERRIPIDYAPRLKSRTSTDIRKETGDINQRQKSAKFRDDRVYDGFVLYWVHGAGGVDAAPAHFEELQATQED